MTEGSSLPAMSTNANQCNGEGCPLPAVLKNTNQHDREVLPPCCINKHESMRWEGSSPPCRVDSCGTHGPNLHGFWHLHNPWDLYPYPPKPIPMSTGTGSGRCGCGYLSNYPWHQETVILPWLALWCLLQPCQWLAISKNKLKSWQIIEIYFI